MAQAAQKKKLSALDGLVIDLFKKVELPLDYARLSADEHMESIAAIHRTLQQVQKHEKERVAKVAAKQGPLQTDQERMQELQRWLQQEGVETAGLELRSGLPEGCGVVAARQFKEGEMLAKIPHSLIMSTISAVQSKEDVAILFALDAWFRAVPSLILAMHLLFEKHRESPQSKWAGYIKSLPGQGSLQYANLNGPVSLLLPLAFSLEAINELRGTTALVEYHRMMRTVAKQYCHMRTVLHQLGMHSPAIEAAASQWFSFSEFRWAVSTVMMRQNPIPAVPPAESGKAPEIPAAVETTLGLIPLLDLFNHEEGPITSHFDSGSYTVELTAKRAFEPGEQVFVSYGSRPNAMLLLYNGFLPKANSRDRARLSVILPESDPLFAKKASLLKWLELAPSAQLDVFADGTPSPALCAWLRVASMTEESQITSELKEIIAKRTKETARRLEDEKLASEGKMPGAGRAALAVGDKAGESGNSTANGAGAGEPALGEKAGDSPQGGVGDLEQHANGDASACGRDTAKDAPASEAAAGGTAASNTAASDQGAASKDTGATGIAASETAAAHQGAASKDTGAMGTTASNTAASDPGLASKGTGATGSAASLKPAEVDLLASACGARLKAVAGERSSVAGEASPAPQGLGLGLKKGSGPKAGKVSDGSLREVALTRQLREGEVEIIQAALDFCKRLREAQQ